MQYLAAAGQHHQHHDHRHHLGNWQGQFREGDACEEERGADDICNESVAERCGHRRRRRHNYFLITTTQIFTHKKKEKQQK